MSEILNLRSPFAVLLAFTFLTACQSGPSPARPPVTHEQSVEAFPLTEWTGVDSIHLALQDDSWSVGGTRAVGGEFISDALRATIWYGGNAVVSDLRQRLVLSIDSTGQAIRFAPSGEGPGEIMFPSALLPWTEGRLAILDNQLQRLSIFERGTPPRFVASQGSSGYPNGTCAAGGTYFGVDFGQDDHHLLGEYSPGGASPRRFGAPLVAGSNLRNNQVAQGPLICALAAQRLWLAPFTGELLTYDMNGDLLSRFRIPEYEDGEWIEHESSIGFRLIATERARSRLIRGMNMLRDGVAVLQLQEYLRAVPDGEPQPGELISILFDAGSGRRIGTQSDLPRILASSDALVLLMEGGEEPMLRLVEYRLLPSLAPAPP